jgi:hypothetical protein
VDGGEADDSVCEFLINMDSEFWTKPAGVFGFWCRDVSGTGTDVSGTGTDMGTTQPIQNTETPNDYFQNSEST